MSAEKQKLERWKAHDFYAVLGILATASSAEVKQGFRKVAITCHPDKVPDGEKEEATRQFQLLAEAYAVLSNQSQREQYDRIRTKSPCDHSLQRKASNQKKESQAWAPPAPTAQAAAAERRRKKDASRVFGVGGRECEGCRRLCPIADIRNCSSCAAKGLISAVCRTCKVCSECALRKAAKPQRSTTRGVVLESESEDEAPNNVSSASKPEKREASDQDGFGDASQEEPLNMFDILSAMGFTETRIHEALKRCSSVEAAVGYLMSLDVDQPREPQEPQQQQKQQMEEERKQKKDRHQEQGRPQEDQPQQQQTMVAYDEEKSMAPGRMAEVWQRRSSGDSRPAASGQDERLSDLVSSLVDLGFSEEHARGAASRCSSIEAAVEYMTERLAASQKLVDDAPAASSGPPSQATPASPTGLKAVLLELGFSEAQVGMAMRRCSSLEAAVEWISSHPDCGE